jgi:hypothetical protein
MTKPNAPPDTQIPIDDADFDRKYFLVSVPDFDIDPVDADGTRKMTSYLRLGTTPDDWKSLPGADLELAVHADYGLGGGRDGLPIGGVVPDEVLPSDPIDERYVPPTPESLYERFAAAVQAALDDAHQLPAVIAWRQAEQAQVTSQKALLAQNQAQALQQQSQAQLIGQPLATSVEDPFPVGVAEKDFVRFLLPGDGDALQAEISQRLENVALGGPTAHLSDAEANAVVDTMRFRGLVDLAVRPIPAPSAPGHMAPAADAPAPPWTILAVSAFESALDAVRADASTRAAATTMEALTDYPDMLLEDGTPKYSPYVDDQRYRGDADDGDEYLSSADRHKNSKYLHTRGGWRDHSDGNRITTTYGDKIEVIRGNYKLMVLGRQDDHGSSNIVDYSGKITQSDDNMLLRVEWIKKDSVWNWEVVNEGIIESEKKSGKAYTWWWGAEKIDITGSDSPTEVTPTNPLGKNDDGLPRSNPHIVERTWARSIKGYTGSAKLPVPSTYDETWADETEEKTTVTRGTISTTTVGLGTIETTTVGAGTISTTTVGGGTLETTTVGGAAISLTAVGGAQVEVTGVIGAIVDVTASLANIEVAAHLVHVEASAVGVHAELKLTGVEIELSATGIKIEGTSTGKEIELHLSKTETVSDKTETFALYKRTTTNDLIAYTTRSETGTAKTLSLSTLIVSAATINLG